MGLLSENVGLPHGKTIISHEKADREYSSPYGE